MLLSLIFIIPIKPESVSLDESMKRGEEYVEQAIADFLTKHSYNFV